MVEENADPQKGAKEGRNRHKERRRRQRLKKADIGTTATQEGRNRHRGCPSKAEIHTRACQRGQR